MKLHSTHQEEAVLANVGEIGEFRIRNSAKAFSILSSGLYANKIRAIIRELSCNAVDSHIAAGKPTTPFDVHLPSKLEPYFAIRDYGTGLTHEQVTNIYTTYFESTKTNSNDFIGALGLGSKSPFSYTDNFTVTAIRGQRKGIYTAFINEQGVPSIALMMEEPTDDPAGVEVKFSVNDFYDFSKFANEARDVYRYFTLQPVITGADLVIKPQKYLGRDLIPGVHILDIDYHRGKSLAVMGNIAYPINVPNEHENLGELASMLNSGIEMHFAIGELDFQASREGLSYIPETIAAIKAKLELVQARLITYLAEEADKITNLWERAWFLEDRNNSHIYRAAVKKYIADTGFPLLHHNGSYTGLAALVITVEELKQKYNIVMHGFIKTRGHKALSTISSHPCSARRDPATQQHTYVDTWQLHPSKESRFIIGDLKVGARARAQYHYRNSKDIDSHRSECYVLDPADRSQPCDFDGFFAFLMGPPDASKTRASSLLEKPRNTTARDTSATIFALSPKNNNYRQELVWRESGKLGDFDSTATFYYVPLSGFQFNSSYKWSGTAKDLWACLQESAIPGLSIANFYGVRKADLAAVQKAKNWKNLEDHIYQTMKALTPETVMGHVAKFLKDHDPITSTTSINAEVADANSPYLKLARHFENVTPRAYSEYAISKLSTAYGATLSIPALANKFVAETKEVHERYPLLRYISVGHRSASAIAEYINLVDQARGKK